MVTEGGVLFPSPPCQMHRLAGRGDSDVFAHLGCWAFLRLGFVKGPERAAAEDMGPAMWGWRHGPGWGEGRRPVRWSLSDHPWTSSTYGK